MLAFGLAPVLLQGNPSGAPINSSGAPPNGSSCAQFGCHVGTGNPFSTGMQLDFGASGATYTPGAGVQTWTLTLPTEALTSAARLYGFQMTARLASDPAEKPAGTFTAGSGQAVICADGSFKPGSGCPAATPIEYLGHDEFASQTNVIQVQWTPPAADVGDVIIYVATNSANGNGQNSGDRITVQNFRLSPAAAAEAKPPQIRSDLPVLQAFSGKPGVSPGTWLEIYGTDLSPVTREWAGSDFNGSTAPTSLSGITVKIAGKSAFIRYVSPTQVNVQAPDDIGTGDGVELQLTNAAGTSATRVTAAKVSPALLTTPNFLINGRQYAAALFTDFRTFVGRENLIPGVAFRPAKPGETIVIYAVGCGPTTPASPAGQIVPAARTLASPVTVRFGSTTATTQAFLAQGAVGLCQFNVTVPNAAAGDIAIEATVDGIAAGQNLFTTIGN